MKQNVYTAETSKISKNLKKFRLQKSFSKSDLVIKTGLDYHTLVKIENGKTPNPGILTVLKIAKALNKNIEELIK